MQKQTINPEVDIKKNLKAIAKDLDAIENKTNRLYFFVMDTKGLASGSLAYVYRLAKACHDAGRNVAMLHQTQDQNDEFVGVGDWLGEEFANLTHYDLRTENQKVSCDAGDILFIPEMFVNLMAQTKDLKCHRVMIMQNFDYILAQLPYNGQFGDSKIRIFDAICNTAENEKLLKDCFPYMRTTVIQPYISKVFGETKEPKKMIVNVVARDQNDFVRLTKPFYYKYPLLRWVWFRDLRDCSQEVFAAALREAPITIWVDEPASFGYSALEAIKSGSLVFAKLPNDAKAWMFNEDGSLNNACIWFDNLNSVQDQIATVIRSWITDNTAPIERIKKEGEAVLERYSEAKTCEDMVKFVDDTSEKIKHTLKAVQSSMEKKVENKED